MCSDTCGNAAQQGWPRTAQPERLAATQSLTFFTQAPNRHRIQTGASVIPSFQDILIHSYLISQALPFPGRWPVWWRLPGNSSVPSWAWEAQGCHWSCSRCRWGRGGPWSKHQCFFSTKCSAAKNKTKKQCNFTNFTFKDFGQYMHYNLST